MNNTASIKERCCPDMADDSIAGSGDVVNILDVPMAVWTFLRGHVWPTVCLILLLTIPSSIARAQRYLKRPSELQRQVNGEFHFLVFYLTSLIEDLVALYMLNEEAHSESELFLVLLAFPFVDFVLKEGAQSFTPATMNDDLAISIALEVAQAFIYSYFADFSINAVGFFVWMMLVQIASITLTFASVEKPRGDEKFEGCSAFASSVFEDVSFSPRRRSASRPFSGRGSCWTLTWRDG